ncbi:V-type ATPase subunit [Actinocrinis puniceicyclus]|uniref:V-type ATPase subunit n=1 Tax=Actinocrinis puniceicyclus TaxID=977794 RepID=A0A8J7WSF0_9ACTN|nr:V-type ATPase subunit [Actinocrinis puniceicyclus]MBS2965900.1 V-type ATPase subunit [Actinocrinis puniceicyclus]
MTAGWVAGTVRARALLDRRVGADGIRRLATQATMDEALAQLRGTAYRRFLPEAADALDAERAVNLATLWNLRVLAGWLPRPGVSALRTLVAEFEIRDLAARLRAIRGESAPPPYRLGALATVGEGALAAGSVGELRRRLASCAWGEPGTGDAAGIVDYLYLSWACRLAQTHPAARAWGAGAAALALARQRFLLGRRPTVTAANRVRPLLGTGALDAADWDGFVAALPEPTAAWTVRGLDGPQRLWLGERRWWSRVEEDAGRLTRANAFALAPVLGCATLLLADARSVRIALSLVAGAGAVTVRDGEDVRA